jgi:hypothetical protein
MTNTQSDSSVGCGTIMLQDGLLLPEHLDVTAKTYSAGWQKASGIDGFAFDRSLRRLGWQCFFLAGELSAVSFGSSHAGMLNRAARRLLAKVRSLDFNCTEFTSVVSSRFLGVPYVRVRGHARHIQHDSQLESAVERNRRKKETEWSQN